MPILLIFIGFVIAGIQVAILPNHWGSIGFIVCMGLVVLFGISYGILAGVLKDKETKTIMLCIYVLSWFSPTAYVIYQSRANFYDFTISHATTQATKPTRSSNHTLCVILSDLHVTDLLETLEHKSGKGKLVKQLLPRVASLHPRCCIISGDLTDRGDPGEWYLLNTILKQYFTVINTSSTQLLFVPGNHDLQGSYKEDYINAAKNIGLVGDRTMEISFVKRMADFYSFASEWEGELLTPSGKKLKDCPFMLIWESIEKDALQRDEGIIPRHGPNHNTPEIWKAIYPPRFPEKLKSGVDSFNTLFPLRYEDPDTGLCVLMLNSSARVSPGASMGLGNIGDEQLTALNEYLTQFRHDHKLKYVFVVMHHAPIRRESDRWTLKQAFSKHVGDTDVYAHTFLSLNSADAKKLMKLLGAFAQERTDIKLVVIHGHRHGSFISITDNGVMVIETPAVGDSSFGFYIIEETSGNLHVSWVDARRLH